MSVSNFGWRKGHEMKKLALFGLMGLAVSAGANLRPAYVFSDGAVPRTFALAGADRKFVAADATLVLLGKDKVRLTVPAGMADVKYVRYGWDPDPDVNLVNSAGLPATPFEEPVQ